MFQEVLLESFAFLVAIFTTLNPLGATPTFLSLTSGYERAQLKQVSKTCAVAVFMALILSAALGSHVLGFFGISMAAFRLGGGLLIGVNAFNMVQAKRAPTKLNKTEITRIDQEDEVKELGVVPLAIPLLVGPGTISTTILFTSEHRHQAAWFGILIASIIIALLVWLIFNSASFIGEKMGKIGINIMTRVMGLILMALSVEFVVGALEILVPKIMKG